MEHLELFFKSIFIDNMVFATFLGMCSYLAVSKKVSTAVGLGAAVIFVLAVTVPLNWLLDQYILQDGALAWLGPEFAEYDLSFLSFILFKPLPIKVFNTYSALWLDNPARFSRLLKSVSFSCFKQNFASPGRTS